MKLCFIKFALPVLGTIFFIVFYGLSYNLTADSMRTEDGSIDTLMTSMSVAPVQQEETIEALCSLRKAVRKDSFYGSRFRFSVPVFQWEESFSTHTWEHLKDKRIPYGWKGLSPNDIETILSSLNSSDLFDRDLPDRCVRCAVVGNGGILRGAKQGKNIDSHDFVFRVNGAVTKGFEEDVGKKTSFYVFSTNTMKNGLRWYKKDGFHEIPQSPDVKYIFIPADIRDYTMIAAALQDQPVLSGFDKGDRPWKYFGHKPPDSFKILHPDFISNVTHSLLNSYRLTSPRTRDVYMPSSGALMLMAALHTCDQVSAYGFITKNYADFSDHYYDSVRKPLKFYANHDMQMEAKLWEELHLRKVMNLYQRKADG